MKNDHNVDDYVYNIKDNSILLIILYNDKIVGTVDIDKLSYHKIWKKSFKKINLILKGKKMLFYKVREFLRNIEEKDYQNNLWKKHTIFAKKKIMKLWL